MISFASLRFSQLQFPNWGYICWGISLCCSVCRIRSPRNPNTEQNCSCGKNGAWCGRLGPRIAHHAPARHRYWSSIPKLRSAVDSWGKSRCTWSAPLGLEEWLRKGGRRLERELRATCIAIWTSHYVMLVVDVLHEPVDVQEMVGEVKPGVENEQIDKSLFHEFN